RDLAAAIEDGRIDEQRHGTLMEAARRCAREIDDDPAPTAALFTVLLNMCKALQIAPTTDDHDRRPRAGGKLAEPHDQRSRVTLDDLRARVGRRPETPLERAWREQKA
ncbi:MAG: hypothetical protein IJG88_04960, partial [Eggerthellaceae bacterium]|nr:hypothetical protein [Eggerthellaceae bacterium]